MSKKDIIWIFVLVILVFITLGLYLYDYIDIIKEKEYVFFEDWKVILDEVEINETSEEVKLYWEENIKPQIINKIEDRLDTIKKLEDLGH